MKRLGIALASIALAGLTGCGSSSLTAKGLLAIVAVDAAEADCSSGTGGYDDIHEGAAVVIYGADNKKLAVGSLKVGRDHEGTGMCVFDFAVGGVPKGKGPYGVEVSHRGQVSFTEDEADAVVISLG